MIAIENIVNTAGLTFAFVTREISVPFVSVGRQSCCVSASAGAGGFMRLPPSSLLGHMWDELGRVAPCVNGAETHRWIFLN